MKWRVFPPLALLAVAAVLLWNQHRARASLRAEVEALRAQAAAAEDLAAQNEALSRLSIDTNEWARLKESRVELLRLRGEIADLRQRARLTPESVADRIAEVETQTVEAQRSAESIRARIAAEDLSIKVRDRLNGIAALLREAAKRGDGKFPTSWDTVRQRLELPAPLNPNRPFDPQLADQRREGLLNWFDQMAQGEIKQTDFEILPVPEQFNSGNSQLSAFLSPTLVLRERNPRQLPDGGWARAYGFLSGEVREAISPDGNFTAWEREVTTPQ